MSTSFDTSKKPEVLGIVETLWKECSGKSGENECDLYRTKLQDSIVKIVPINFHKKEDLHSNQLIFSSPLIQVIENIIMGISCDMDHNSQVQCINRSIKEVIDTVGECFYGFVIDYAKQVCYQLPISEEEKKIRLRLLHGVFRTNKELQSVILNYIKNDSLTKNGIQFSEQVDVIPFHLFLFDFFDDPPLTEKIISQLDIIEDEKALRESSIMQLFSHYESAIVHHVTNLEGPDNMRLCVDFFLQLCEHVNQFIRIRSMQEVRYIDKLRVGEKSVIYERNIYVLEKFHFVISAFLERLSCLPENEVINDLKERLLHRKNMLDLVYGYMKFRMQKSEFNYVKQAEEILRAQREAYFSMEKIGMDPEKDTIWDFTNRTVMPKIYAYLSGKTDSISRHDIITACNTSFIMLQTWQSLFVLHKEDPIEDYTLLDYGHESNQGNWNETMSSIVLYGVRENMDDIIENFISLYNTTIEDKSHPLTTPVDVFTHFMSDLDSPNMKSRLPFVDHIVRFHPGISQLQYKNFLEKLVVSDKFQDTVYEQFKIIIIQLLLDKIENISDETLLFVQEYANKNNTHPDLLLQYGRLYKQLSILYSDKDKSDICFHTYLATIGVSHKNNGYERISAMDFVSTKVIEEIFEKLSIYNDERGFNNWYKGITIPSIRNISTEIIMLSSYESIDRMNEEICRIISSSQIFKWMCEISISMDNSKVPSRAMGFKIQSLDIPIEVETLYGTPRMHFVYRWCIETFIDIGIKEISERETSSDILHVIGKRIGNECEKKRLYDEEHINATTKLENKTALQRDMRNWMWIDYNFVMINVNVLFPGFFERANRGMSLDGTSETTETKIIDPIFLRIAEILKDVVSKIPSREWEENEGSNKILKAHLYDLNLSLFGIIFPNFLMTEEIERYKDMCMEAIRKEIYLFKIPGDQKSVHMSFRPTASKIVSSTTGVGDVYDKAHPDIQTDRALASAIFSRVEYGDSFEKLKSDMILCETIINAIDNSGVLPYFQLKRHKDSAQDEDSYECLMRLRKADGTMISPDEFIDKAAEWWFLPLLMDQLLLKIGRFMSKNNVSISINMGKKNLEDPQFLECIERVFVLHDTIDRSRLKIEILETVTDEDIRNNSSLFLNLFDLGHHFHLDDWGTRSTNESKLNALINLIGKDGVSLKIDQEFVRKISKRDGKVVSHGMFTVSSALEYMRAAYLKIKGKSQTAPALQVLSQFIGDLEKLDPTNGQLLFATAEKITKWLKSFSENNPIIADLGKDLVWMVENMSTIISTIETAKKRKIGIIVEWVETEEIAQLLWSFGGDELNIACQGYFFGKPISEEELSDKLSQELRTISMPLLENNTTQTRSKVAQLVPKKS